MRVVLLIPRLHAGSEFAFNKLLKEDDLNIVGVVISDISIFKKSYWKYILYGIRRSGLFYGFLVGLVAYLHVIGLFIASIVYFWRRRQWLTVDELIQEYKLNHCITEDINSQESIKQIKEWDPDILISLKFNQILKKDVISLPKVAAINLHPGILPGYRGIWTDFWKLYRDEKVSGVTIHHINEKIDEGEILDLHKFPIDKDETKFSLSLKAAHHGVKRLLIVLSNFKNGIKMHPIPKKGKSKYWSLPKEKHFSKFHHRRKKLFDFFRDIRRIVFLSRNINSKGDIETF
jgi:methionyl-tRNA formyltransferase